MNIQCFFSISKHITLIGKPFSTVNSGRAAAMGIVNAINGPAPSSSRARPDSNRGAEDFRQPERDAAKCQAAP